MRYRTSDGNSGFVYAKGTICMLVETATFTVGRTMAGKVGTMGITLVDRGSKSNSLYIQSRFG